MFIPIPKIMDQLTNITTEVYYKESPQEIKECPFVVIEDRGFNSSDELEVIIWNSKDNNEKSTGEISNRIIESLKNFIFINCNEAYYRLKLSKYGITVNDQNKNLSGIKFVFREAGYLI